MLDQQNAQLSYHRTLTENPQDRSPQGWNAHDPSQLAINDTVYYRSAGKSARYAAHAAIGRTFEEQHGPMELSVAMRTEVSDSFMLYIDDGSGDYRGANIYFMLTGNLEYYDGDYHNICPFSVNTWYQIKMEIDVPGNTYDIETSISKRSV
jgi:hypothetical protein